MPAIVILLDRSSKFLIDACHRLKSQEDERVSMTTVDHSEHYLQVTDADFDRATTKAHKKAQSGQVSNPPERSEEITAAKKTRETRKIRSAAMTPTGLEPVLPA